MAPLESGGTVLLYSMSWFPSQVDGIAVRMMALAGELASRGLRVVVVTPDFHLSGLSEPKTLARVPATEMETVRTSRTPIYRKNMGMEMSLRNFKKLLALLRHYCPKVVHVTQDSSTQLWVAACLCCRIPLVISLHTDITQIAARDRGFSFHLGSGQLGRLHARFAVMMTNFGYRNWARGGPCFFPVSAQARSSLLQAGVASERLSSQLWGPMVDTKVFRIDLPDDVVSKARHELTLGIPGAFLMVYCGRVTAEKDVMFLVDALSRTPPHVVLALVGPGSLVVKLKPLHGRANRLYCTGEMASRAQVAAYLRAADCCVSASTMETVGFTAMEALSCGTPMLAANAQGFAEHLQHGVNARLWTPDDPSSFDEELRMLMVECRSAGNWSPESLRASVAATGVQATGDQALRVYRDARLPERYVLRLAVSLFWAFAQLLVALVVR